MERRVGARGLAAAAQDRGVAGHHAQRAGVGGDVGPRFRRSGRSRRSARAPGRAAARWDASGCRWSRRPDRAARRPPPARRRSPRSARRQRQPVDQRGRQGSGLGQVGSVRGEDRVRLRRAPRGGGGQRGGLLRGRCAREQALGRTRAAGEVGDNVQWRRGGVHPPLIPECGAAGRVAVGLRWANPPLSIDRWWGKFQRQAISRAGMLVARALEPGAGEGGGHVGAYA